MESESGENVEYFWMLRKSLLIRFCFVAVFSTRNLLTSTLLAFQIKPQGEIWTLSINRTTVLRFFH